MAIVSLCVFCAVYALIFTFGIIYIHKLLRTGPQGRLAIPADGTATRRPMSIIDGPFPALVPPAVTPASAPK
jgi:cytochrome bd ubiquinol oxidase subunit I